MSSSRSVVPLESNPEVFATFAHNLGLRSSYGFTDIYSLTDPEILAFTPRPIKAIILLFPINEITESASKNDNSQTGKVNVTKNPVWFKQTIKNACGLYALLHSLSNNQELLNKDCELTEFLLANSSKDGKYEDKATDDFIVNISERFSNNFNEGQTSAPDPNEDINLHFITFVESNNKIFELDGRRPNGAFELGDASSSAMDLADQDLVKKRVQWYMDSANESDKLKFSLLALISI
ncbi:hypothetical protein TBLA_0F02610 [Henningerozyma blattae CBS 6284]|uniref:Ubiquitin carboxyl-terminal hydrolase n=1 Tax=Henningerozyma blattae (strain ATCC 34711 / CBS 6284 / DSM 70876 / NBRC 10599 / NRRL Y-10934 / UCD 77-7) TaxID=1071380 RepID=I2H5Z8_HENB6|nr:hypothetical protein TBLA_0F02610 [Tetrapisispora blattae CBS 6284]CCH61800.1 hypothetical protein TBLA_0F02610 [Tetrapisispora blattae CBS 6284]